MQATPLEEVWTLTWQAATPLPVTTLSTLINFCVGMTDKLNLYVTKGAYDVEYSKGQV